MVNHKNAPQYGQARHPPNTLSSGDLATEGGDLGEGGYYKWQHRTDTCALTSQPLQVCPPSLVNKDIQMGGRGYLPRQYS